MEVITTFKWNIEIYQRLWYLYLSSGLKGIITLISQDECKNMQCFIADKTYIWMVYICSLVVMFFNVVKLYTLLHSYYLLSPTIICIPCQDNVLFL